MEFLMSNWMVVLGVLVVIVGSFYVPFLRNFIMIGFRSLLSEAVIKRMLLMLTEKAVKSTKNNLDALWLAQLKKKLDA